MKPIRTPHTRLLITLKTHLACQYSFKHICFQTTNNIIRLLFCCFVPQLINLSSPHFFFTWWSSYLFYDFFFCSPSYLMSCVKTYFARSISIPPLAVRINFHICYNWDVKVTLRQIFINCFSVFLYFYFSIFQVFPLLILMKPIWRYLFITKKVQGDHFSLQINNLEAHSIFYNRISS